MLMVPDLVNHELCGSTTNEVTNASTTQLLGARTHSWDDALVAELGLRRDLLPALHQPGAELGRVDGVGPGIDGVALVAAASHDTASAVVGTPLRGDRPGVYISCGTWSLVGCEVAAPVTTAAALAANVTNELGIAGTTRLLKNVTGLWLLEESRRAWHLAGVPTDVAELVAAADALPGGRSVVDPDDPRFAAPGAMPDHIAEACRASGQFVPTTPAEVTRVILDSLALAWRRTVGVIERISGIDADVVHLVGGGAANELLGRLCASACGRPVLAGPVEATVIGNALVQAITDGVVADLAHGRALIERTLPPVRIHPAPMLDWDALTDRIDAIGAAR
jgi:rhamnulokinase